jgi:hypothetical protein
LRPERLSALDRRARGRFRISLFQFLRRANETRTQSARVNLVGLHDSLDERVVQKVMKLTLRIVGLAIVHSVSCGAFIEKVAAHFALTAAVY